MDYLRIRMTKNQILIGLAVFALAVIVSEGYGFDAGASCSEKTARRGRAQLLKSIPCDLSVQAYCNLPGSMYPWHAVRRFVNENQGMMKRMYGDVRHLSVLRNEINNNDITLEDVEERAIRYSRAGWKRNKYLYQQDSTKTKQSDLLSEAHYRRASTRPTGRSTSRTRGRTTQRTSPATPSSTIETSAPSSTHSSTTEPTPTKKIKFAERREKISTSKLARKPESPKENSSDDPYEEVIEAAIEEIFDQFGNENTNANIANKNLFANVSENEKLAHDFKNDANDNIEIFGAPDLSTGVNKSEVAATISTTLRIYGFSKEEKTTTLAPLNTTIENVTVDNRTESLYLKLNSTTPKSQLDENLIQFEVDTSDIDPISAISLEDSTSAESIDTESIVDINGNENTDKIPKPSDDTIGQLYQDVAQKEEPILINSKGVNACPVKEEVVAPFWANNTRGEVLALLNLYPFEQYVHWEKCTQENKQMYCRDGCRCEQQYRLHRLLAYDPHNECRGIFSDWFRFPSCCICKCYNVPFEYRVTSRSPRSMGKLMKNENDELDAGDRSDQGIDDDLDIEEHENNNWYHKKSIYNDDLVDVFNDEMEF